MLKNWLRVLLYTLILCVGHVSAGSVELAVVIHVIGVDANFQRANTQIELPLAVGASAPSGKNDRIRTQDNGRVLITIGDEFRILLLPNSEFYILDAKLNEDHTMYFSASLQGVAVHDLPRSTTTLEYELTTQAFQISNAEGHFAVWAVPEGLNAVTNSTGQISLTLNDNTQETVLAGMGYAVPYSSTSIALESPLHASQVVAHSIGCDGIVETNGSLGLRLRAGAALDYIVVDILQDGQQVQIVGITQNQLWYRIPFQTGFGWIYSSLISANCEGLQEFPNLIGELPENIQGVTNVELELLEPFYGTPTINQVFYR